MTDDDVRIIEAAAAIAARLRDNPRSSSDISLAAHDLFEDICVLIDIAPDHPE